MQNYNVSRYLAAYLLDANLRKSFVKRVSVVCQMRIRDQARVLTWNFVQEIVIPLVKVFPVQVSYLGKLQSELG